MGGLSKKAFQLNRLRPRDGHPSLLLDAGNLLFKSERLSPSLQDQAELTAAGLAKAYNLMGYDGVAAGRQDLAAGLSFFLKLKDKSSFTWLSANLVRRSSRKPVLPASISRQLGDLHVAIIGLTNEAGPPLLDPDEDAMLLKWQEVLPALAASLKEKHNFLILLANLPMVQAREVAAAVPQIDLMILSGAGGSNFAETTHQTFLCKTLRQGKFLGRLGISWERSPDLTGLKRERLALRRQITRLREESASGSPPGISALLQKEALLAQEIGAAEKGSGARPVQPVFKNDFIALKAEMPDDSKVLQVVEEIKKRLPRPRTDRSAPASWMQELTGWQACASCHRQEARAWAVTPHARAFQSLVAKKQQFNLTCLPCHVTGQEQSDAQPLTSLPPVLRAVGCEACHGPGRLHARAPRQKPLLRTPGPAVCLRCHTPEQDDTFDYAQDLKSVHSKWKTVEIIDTPTNGQSRPQGSSASP